MLARLAPHLSSLARGGPRQSEGKTQAQEGRSPFPFPFVFTTCANQTTKPTNSIRVYPLQWDRSVRPPPSLRRHWPALMRYRNGGLQRPSDRGARTKREHGGGGLSSSSVRGRCGVAVGRLLRYHNMAKLEQLRPYTRKSAAHAASSKRNGSVFVPADPAHSPLGRTSAAPDLTITAASRPKA